MQTKMLSSDESGLTRASELLSGGGLVAFPTETVYGLGCDARNDLAVAHIFEAKRRPHFNPLIVHLDSKETAQSYVNWTDAAERLAEAFWPGPLTLVLPVREGSGVSSLVTANLPTLAVRVPKHPIAVALLQKFGGPVAAPSANLSGKISPTNAPHVASGLKGRIDAIVEGGACGVGVESTILGLKNVPTLLRPGGIPQEAIEAALGEPIALHQPGDALTAPGQMSSHYAPSAPLRQNVTDIRPGEILLGFGPVLGATLNLSEAGDLGEAAANLFLHLHELDTLATGTIAVSPIPNHGLGRAINDRLARAAKTRP